MEAIDKILDRYPDAGKDALIPILQDIQNEMNYLTEEAIIKTGRYLQIPTSRIYSIATFYDQFRFSPQGKKHIRICRGTACHVMGSLADINEVTKQLGVAHGQTSKNGLFSLEVVQCMGACGLAPVVSVNGDFYDKVNPEKMRRIIETHRNEEENK
jgi:NADH-quinone oxidoreductase subunit E